jgi:hypothetical protein
VNRTARPHVIVWLGAGFVVWSIALVALYALHAVGCAFAWPAVPLRVGLATVILVHLAALALIWHRLAVHPAGVMEDDTLGFLVALSLCATIAATAATVLIFGPALLLTTCV